MKRWLSHCTIAVYLCALSWGILSHTIKVGTGVHPVMYYLVWDMFCGWASYESRLQIIGEGESGRYYELAPGPWGEFRPFGNIGRRHYDTLGNHSPRLALNAIRQTSHEPIVRVFVVEECWAKKYNIPDELWSRWYDEPKDLETYHQVRHVYTPDGALVQSYPSWLSRQYALCLADNPRLVADARRNRPFFAVNPRGDSAGTYTPGSFHPSEREKVGSRLGN